MSEYQGLQDTASSHQAFIQQIARFVQQLYANGLPLRQSLSNQQACIEAVFLLERLYQGSHGRGYEAAFIEARSHDHCTIGIIITRFTEAIKLNQREKYLRWVYTSVLSKIGWETKCQVVELLLDRLNPFLTDQLSGCAPAQLTDNIPDLIQLHLHTSGLLEKISPSTKNSFKY